MKTTTNVANIPHWQNLSLQNIENEVWKPMTGFEKLYSVSSLGRVMSLSKPKWNGKKFYNIPTKIMKQTLAKKTGYLVLRINGKSEYVHRVIAMTFKPNSNCDNLDINHIDGIKTNNTNKNLEWSTRKHNIKHSFKTGLRKKSTKSRSTINEATAIKILIKFLETGYGRNTLKKLYFKNVSVSSIQTLTSNKSWTYLPRNIEELERRLESIEIYYD